MAETPWKTSDDIIESVQRKISIPIYQTAITPEDILKHANEEMFISQVPSMLQVHEEYFVTTLDVELETNKTNYSIPDRAIGMKLRDIFFKDTNGNLFEMTRIQPEDRAFFQRSSSSNPTLHKFFVQGNDIVIVPELSSVPDGKLMFVFFIRPNQLVRNSRAAISNSFNKLITIDNSNIIDGDTLTIDDIIFTAVSGSPGANEFQIGLTSTITATNLVSSINTNGTFTSSNGSPSTNVVKVNFDNRNLDFETDSDGIVIDEDLGIDFGSIPSNITNGSIVDFLQTKPGHKIKGISIKLANNAISGNSIYFDNSVVPVDFIVGDYVCLENECIIPQIPPEVHVSLIERVCARVLASIGDQAGLQAVNEKLQEIEVRQGNILDNRVEGAPQKVVNRNSHLSYNSYRYRRRF